MKINHSISSLSRAQLPSSSSAPPLPLPPSPPLQEVSGTPLASPAFAPLISSTSSPPLLSSPSPPLQSLTAPPTKNALPPATPLLAPPVSNSQRPVRPPEVTHAAPPPPAMLEYITPPSPPSDAYQTPPMGRYPPLETPPPPPMAFSYPPPMPGSVIPKAPGPPSMLINGSEQPQPTPIGLSLSPPSSSSIATPIELIVGISIAVAGCFFIIALILLCFCYRRKKTRYFNDYESPPPKDNFYAALPQHLNQRIPAPGGAHVIQAPAKHNLLQRQVSSGGNSCSPHSESENPFSPQALGHGFGFSTGNFTYEELVAATGGFSEANLLGEGGFGYVHKGILPTGREIAVKQLKMGSRQGEREFQAEVETISRVHHRHLVSLVGYCITGVKRLLVYEFVPNRTLEFHLHGTREPVMNWQTRLKIAIGSAKGLAYLHEDCNPTIIHRDIKAANILLDSKFEAKVSDFGLAKFFSDANHCISHVSTRVVGTFGYLAPEYAQSGKASDKSDVFSYGVMLLELITGRPPIMEPESSMSDSLVSWARPFLRRALEDGDFFAMVDPRLQGHYNREELATMVACAAACVRHSSWRRPRMSQIIRALEGDVSLEDLDEGIRPGQSTVSSFFDYDSHTFKEMSKLKMTLASQESDIESSGDSTSEDDPHPSESSPDGRRPLERQHEDKERGNFGN